MINRKKALFAGHDQGVEKWPAFLASLIETCKLHGVDPQTYVTDVLTKVVNLARPQVSTSYTVRLAAKRLTQYLTSRRNPPRSRGRPDQIKPS